MEEKDNKQVNDKTTSVEKQDKTQKPKKQKKFIVRRFIKEIKRIRWPGQKTNWISLFKVVLFTTIFVLVCLAFTTLLTLFWGKIGLGN